MLEQFITKAETLKKHINDLMSYKFTDNKFGNYKPIFLKNIITVMKKIKII